MLKFGIIGFGGLGKSHFRNTLNLRDDIELVAICDVEETQFHNVTATNLGGDAEPLDLSKYHLYTDAEEMLNQEKLDFVITALPTYLHEKYAVMALDKGLHVFSEKPMARTLEGCKNMVEAAIRNNKLLTIGQCVRFDGGYGQIKKYYDSGEFGKLMRLDMTRYSYPPIWAWQNWFMDYEKSGGAALDLHVHDVDYINYMLGRPDAVSSEATHRTCPFDCISTRYYYKDGPIVHATGDWSLFPSYGFHPGFIAVFEKAVYSLSSNGFMVYPEEGEPYQPEFDPANAYVKEIDYFIDCIKNSVPNEIASAESTMQSIEIALAEIKSAETGQIVTL